MARIIYAINGEGMGHATRSMALIEDLRKRHEIMIIAGSSRIYPFIKKKHDNVKKYEGLRLTYKDNKIDDLQTLKRYIGWLTKQSPPSIRRLYHIFKRFKADVLITDFEGTTAYLANLMDIPVICVCNVHAMTKLKYSVPKKYIPTSMKAKLVVRTIFPKADYHLITTFFYPAKKSDKVFLFPPILRKEVFDLTPKDKGYILVYQTSDTNNRLLNELKNINRDFVIYGFDKNMVDKNLTFRKFNNKQWLKDLSQAHACIANGGYSFISEAISLHKPVLSVPVKGQFEQILNAIFLKRLGYGDMCDEIDRDKIIRFLKKIPQYEKNLDKFQKQDNSRILAKLEELIEMVQKK